MTQMRESTYHKSLEKRSQSREWGDNQAEAWVKAWKEGWAQGWKEGWIQGQIELGQTMLGLFIARRFPRAKVARRIAQLRDVAVLKELCLALNFNEIPNMVALRQRLDDAIKSQKAK